MIKVKAFLIPKYFFLSLISSLILVNYGCSKKIADGSTDFNYIKKDTILISESIDLKGSTISFQNKILNFSSPGLIKNGIIYGENIEVRANKMKIFEDVTLTGNWNTKNVFIEWFLGNRLTDAVVNFKVIRQLISVNVSIYLNSLIPIAVSDPYDYHESGRNIVITGKDKKTSGLIFVTKHGNPFFSYFRSIQGYNLSLKNITLTTKDFLDGKVSDISAEYFFTGSHYQQQFNPTAKPSIDSIILDNCLVLGNIAISLNAAHSDNQTIKEFGEKNKISKLIVQNSTFENVNSPFVFSNMGYDSIQIKNNTIKNFSESFLSIPESGINDQYYEPLRRNKTYVEFLKNIFENTRVIKTSDGRALTPCVIKGGYGTMNFTGNTLKNLLSSNPATDVHTMYYTCASPGSCTFSNNTVMNVIGRGGINNPASVVKDRGANDLKMENNNISIDKNALMKIGVLKNVGEDISKLKGDKFLCTFIQIGNQTELTKKLVIRNNRFRVPFINMSTEIYDVAEFVFENNKIEIDYFGPSGRQISVSRDDVFFLGRQRLDKLPEKIARDFILRGNKITIHKTGGKTFDYLGFPDGVQAGSIQYPDINFNYKNVIIQDTFFVNDTQFGCSLPDGENHKYKIALLGKNNSAQIEDATGANHLRPNAKTLQTSIHIQNYKNHINATPFVLIPGSTQVLTIQKHNGSDIPLLSYNYLTSLYNLAVEENLVFFFEAEWHTKNGKNKTEFYFYLHNKSRLISIERGVKKWVDIDPVAHKSSPEELFQKSSNTNRSSKDPKPLFYSGDRHVKNAELKLTNCENVESITITLNVLKAGYQKYTPDVLSKQVSEIIESRK